MNNKIGEAEKWRFDFLDRQDTFNELMSKEPKPPNKLTNEHNPIICADTPTPEKKKKKQEFEVMEDMKEDEDYALSLDYLDGL